MATAPISIAEFATPKAVRKALDRRRYHGAWARVLDADTTLAYRYLREASKAMRDYVDDRLDQFWDFLPTFGPDWVAEKLVGGRDWDGIFRATSQGVAERAYLRQCYQEIGYLQRAVGARPTPRYGWYASGNGNLLRDKDDNVLLWGYETPQAGRSHTWYAGLDGAVVASTDVTALETAEALYKVALGVNTRLGDQALSDGPLRATFAVVAVDEKQFRAKFEPAGRGRWTFDGWGTDYGTLWDAWMARGLPNLVPSDPQRRDHQIPTNVQVTTDLSTAMPAARGFAVMFTPQVYETSKFAAHWNDIGFTRSTTDELRWVLEDGVAGGARKRDVARRVQQVFEGVDPVRATYPRSFLIAQTEMTSARNYAKQEQWATSGWVEGKEWSAALDSRTREWHAAASGQVVGIKEPFIVGGAEMMYPGDWNGGPANTCRCRCCMLPSLMEAVSQPGE